MGINYQAEIDEIAALPENWDGYGAIRVSQQVADNARSVLSILGHIPGLDISPNPNGTISLEFEDNKLLSHLEIGRNRYSMFVRSQDSSGPGLHFDGSFA